MGLTILALALVMVVSGIFAMKERLPVIAIVLIGGAIIITPNSFISCVSTGHVAVPTQFGRVVGHTLPEGINLVSPLWATPKMSIRTETYTMAGRGEEGGQGTDADALEVLSADNTELAMDVTVAYRLNAHAAPFVYQNFGANYVQQIVRPAVRAAVRDAAAGFPFIAAISTSRADLQVAIKEETLTNLAGMLSGYEGIDPFKVISVPDVMVRGVKPPAEVQAEINRKMAEQQKAEAMVFVVKQQEQEKERMRVEAEAIAEYERIINSTITPDLLRWKTVEMLTKAAEAGGQFIIVPLGEAGSVPLILQPNKK